MLQALPPETPERYKVTSGCSFVPFAGLGGEACNFYRLPPGLPLSPAGEFRRCSGMVTFPGSGGTWDGPEGISPAAGGERRAASKGEASGEAEAWNP